MNDRSSSLGTRAGPGLSGRTALVTGGAGGLGSAAAADLAAYGAQVVVADLPGKRLDDAVARLTEHGDVRGLGVDLSHPQACRGLPAAAAALLERPAVDVVVHAAGILHTQPIEKLTYDGWRRTLAINLDSAFLIVQAAGAQMAHQGRGSIIVISSVAGRSGRPDAADYAASKAALISVTRSCALAYAPKVRVNAVCPGVFLTPMWDSIISDRSKEFGAGAGERYLDDVAARTPLLRVGQPTELAAVITFLAGDLASFVTGQAINVDGGLEMN